MARHTPIYKKDSFVLAMMAGLLLIMIVITLSVNSLFPSTSMDSLYEEMNRMNGSPDISSNASVNIIAYLDFGCPHCKRQFGLLQQVHESYPEQVNIELRHLPLQGSERSAIAAECAADQGAEWEYSRHLFAGSRTDYIGLAEEIGLDGNGFSTCLYSGGKEGVVEGYMQQAKEDNIRGTPTIIVDGEKQAGFVSEEQLMGMITDETGQ